VRLVVFGGSGRAGRLVVKQALAAGHEVTVLARSPHKLDLRHERLRVVMGNALDPAPVAQAVAGADAIVSLIGPGKDQPPMTVSKSTATIIAAAKDCGVERLVVVVGAGVGDAQDRPALLDKLIIAVLKRAAASVYEDMKATAAIVRASDREWTLVRIPMLTDQPATGKPRVGYLGQGVGSRLSREELAAFLLKQVADRAYVHAAPVVSN
jgi:putative NADH-flavin reductase